MTGRGLQGLQLIVNSVTFLLYSLMTNNRGKLPSERKEPIDRKKMFAGYVVNKTYTSDLNITNDNTVSSAVSTLGAVQHTWINLKTLIQWYTV
jgi:hypothetical protein